MIRVRYGILAFLLLLMGGGPASAGTIFVSGRVSTRATGAPLPGAVISLYTPNAEDPATVAQSLPNGSYVLKAPSAGHYRVTVSCSGYLPLEQQLDVPAAGLKSLNLAAAQVLPLRIRLIDAGGNPLGVQEVEVSLMASIGKRYRRMQTRAPMKTLAGGILQIPVPTLRHNQFPEDFVVSVRDPLAGLGEIHVKKWPEDMVTLHLGAGKTVGGQVMDAVGAPIARTMVYALRVLDDGTPRDFQPEGRALTDATGHFMITALPEGKYMIRALIRRAGQHFRTLALTEARTDITLTPDDEQWPPRTAR